jgi:transcriptional regulator with AAA-type ATPase domain
MEAGMLKPAAMQKLIEGSPDYKLYAILKKILAERPSNSAAIKSEMEKILGKPMDPQSYTEAILCFFFHSIFTGGREIDAAKEYLKKYFCDDLKQAKKGPLYITYLALFFEGLEDFIGMDLGEKEGKMSGLLIAMFFQGTGLNFGKVEGSNIDINKIDFPPSSWMKEIYSHAVNDRPLIIVGETGTSKELLCRVIHTISKRRLEPLEEINCAAIPDKLLESELFGHEKGTFTDAKQSKKGRLEIADGGIVFLDEIGKMAPHLQAKILKVVEEKNFRRLGSEDKKPIDVDIRFIAATQPDDLKKVLPDLKFRLGYPWILKTPTLNERLMESGKSIIASVLSSTVRKMGLVGVKMSISEKGYERLLNYKYEGNYRELENILWAAASSAWGEHRKIVLPEDLTVLDNQFETLADDTHQTAPKLKMSCGDIMLKDIIEYTEKISAAMIEEKVISILKSGRSLKSAYLSEGNSKKEYQNFWKKITRITGKNIRDLELAAKEESKLEKIQTEKPGD